MKRWESYFKSSIKKGRKLYKKKTNEGRKGAKAVILSPNGDRRKSHFNSVQARRVNSRTDIPSLRTGGNTPWR